MKQEQFGFLLKVFTPAVGTVVRITGTVLRWNRRPPTVQALMWGCPKNMLPRKIIVGLSENRLYQYIPVKLSFKMENKGFRGTLFSDKPLSVQIKNCEFGWEESEANEGLWRENHRLGNFPGCHMFARGFMDKSYDLIPFKKSCTLYMKHEMMVE